MALWDRQDLSFHTLEIYQGNSGLPFMQPGGLSGIDNEGVLPPSHIRPVGVSVHDEVEMSAVGERVCQIRLMHHHDLLPVEGHDEGLRGKIPLRPLPEEQPVPIIVPEDTGNPAVQLIQNIKGKGRYKVSCMDHMGNSAGIEDVHCRPYRRHVIVSVR